MNEPFERRRLRVYVAGPISSNVYEGVNRGIAAGRRMFLDGLAPFVPHFDAFWWLPDGNWRAYLEYDLEYVSVCDAVYRLSGDSQGADKEVRIAREHGIPVFHEGDDELYGRDSGLGYWGLLKYAESQGLLGIRQAQDGPTEVAK